MFSIDIRSSVPIFEQIYQEIGKFIALGVLKPNEQLPTVRTLAKELGINPNTVSKAYQEAERSNLVYSITGVGMFVAETATGLENVFDNAYQKLFDAIRVLMELGLDVEAIIQGIKERQL